MSSARVEGSGTEPSSSDIQESAGQHAATSGLAASSKVSFDVKKKEKFVNSSNVLRNDKAPDDDDGRLNFSEDKPQQIAHFDNDRLSDFDNSKEKHGRCMVIPMVVQKDWRIERIQKLRKDGKLTSEDISRLQLFSEALDSSLKNEDSKIDGGIAEGSEVDADYDCVPVEGFGLAVLRGCGWTDGEGIGKSNKRVVPLKMPPRRPKGLGLGADTHATPLQNGRRGDIKSGSNNDDSGTLKISSFVKIVSGIYRDSYGKVEGFDEDNASVIVRLALGNKNVRVNQFSVAVISQVEYERDAKCINKKAYDRAKVDAEDKSRRSGHKDSNEARDFGEPQDSKDLAKERKHNSHGHSRRHRDTSERSDDTRRAKNSEHYRSSHSEKRHLCKSSDARHAQGEEKDNEPDCTSRKKRKWTEISATTARVKEEKDDGHCSSHCESGTSKANELEKKELKRQHYSHMRATPADEYYKKRESKMWVRPNLKVRFINKKFQEGRLYKAKVIVVDVRDQMDCAVQDIRGTIYYGIHEDWLDKLRPNVNDKVMVVAGTFSGQVGLVMTSNTSTERSEVMLFETDEVVKVSFDDVTEYVSSRDEEDFADL